MTVQTAFGPVRVKVGRRGGRVVTASPEYEDVRRRAEERGAAFREVYEAARKSISDFGMSGDGKRQTTNGNAQGERRGG